MSAACFGEPQLFLKVGDPVSGFLECTNSKKHFGAQMTGWPKALATEWKKIISPASSPSAFELDGDVIAALPRTKRGSSDFTKPSFGVLVGSAELPGHTSSKCDLRLVRIAEDAQVFVW